LMVKSLWRQYDRDIAVFPIFERVPRLSHLVIMSLEFYPHDGVWKVLDGLVAHIKRNPRSCRVIIGRDADRNQRRGSYGHGRATSSLYDCCDVIVLSHEKINEWPPPPEGKWFRERIVDGTLWEFDFEGYRDPHNCIEVHQRTKLM
jgi:hypothetical protein